MEPFFGLPQNDVLNIRRWSNQDRLRRFPCVGTSWRSRIGGFVQTPNAVLLYSQPGGGGSTDDGTQFRAYSKVGGVSVTRAEFWIIDDALDTALHRRHDGTDVLVREHGLSGVDGPEHDIADDDERHPIDDGAAVSGRTPGRAGSLRQW